MGNAPPKQGTLDVSMFPDEPWAKALVETFNKFSLETTRALTGVGGVQKTLTFKTGATVANSFPIDVKVESVIMSVRVAMVLVGVPSGAMSVTASMLSSGRSLRVSNISGLAANTSYSLRLALE